MSININTSEVSNIAKNINSRRNEISTIYKSKLLPALKSSEECLKVSGLSYDEVIASFSAVFSSLDSQLAKLTNELTNNVIPNYQSSANVINRMFNTEFADQVRQTLSIMNEK